MSSASPTRTKPLRSRASRTNLSCPTSAAYTVPVSPQRIRTR
ncbi:ORFL80W [Human betaherpesvirus 5]|nr:ORFL80W [Human betaherpesvirus 5]QHX40391.1 ORFL80W [Human betaherpesvirus 5]